MNNSFQLNRCRVSVACLEEFVKWEFDGEQGKRMNVILHKNIWRGNGNRFLSTKNSLCIELLSAYKPIFVCAVCSLMRKPCDGEFGSEF